MKFSYHQLPSDIFVALAKGGGGPTAIRGLASIEYSKHMIFLRGVAAAEGDEQDGPASRGYDLLAAAWRKDRAATERLIKHPSIGLWARRTIEACRGGQKIPGAEPSGLCAVGAAAAISAGVPAEIEVTVTEGQVMLPSLGVATVPGNSALVRTGPGAPMVGDVEIPADLHQDAPGWLGLRRVQIGPFDILIDDLDPFRMPDAPDLAARGPAEPWYAALRNAWPVLERSHPSVVAEAEGIRVIVPRSRPAEGQVSTSSPEAFGTIAMSLPPDAVTCAETFAHEIQHLKLAALLDVVGLLEPDDGRRYYAPWREDPRPLSGLLQGAYAYLGVSGFWRRQRHVPGSGDRGDFEYSRWRAAAALAAEVIQSTGRLTPAGGEFVRVMIETLKSWQSEPVRPAAKTRAHRVSEAHLARWRSRNGPVPLG